MSSYLLAAGMHFDLLTPEQLERAQQLEKKNSGYYKVSDVNEMGRKLKHTRLYFYCSGEAATCVEHWVLAGEGSEPD